MARNRYDETWHRLREWTKGQAPSERLAALILIQEGFLDVDPSHPQMTLHIHRNVTDAGAGTHDQQHRAKFKQGATQGK